MLDPRPAWMKEVARTIGQQQFEQWKQTKGEHVWKVQNEAGEFVSWSGPPGAELPANAVDIKAWEEQTVLVFGVLPRKGPRVLAITERLLRYPSENQVCNGIINWHRPGHSLAVDVLRHEDARGLRIVWAEI